MCKIIKLTAIYKSFDSFFKLDTDDQSDNTIQFTTLLNMETLLQGHYILLEDISNFNMNKIRNELLEDIKEYKNDLKFFNIEDVTEKCLNGKIDLYTESYNDKSDYTIFLSKFEEFYYENLNLDKILDKINESGIKSLYEVEVKYLNKVK